MAITLSTNYSNFLKKPHEEVWLVELANSGGGYVRVATDDAEDDSSNQYYGIILNKLSIREKIDLYKSTSSVSNISIDVANINYNGSNLSEELVFGTNNYINQNVKIYSLIRYDSTRALNFNEIDSTFSSYPNEFISDQTQTTETIVDTVLIYSGRLESISHDHNKINLNIVAKRPWDDLSIPNSITTNRNVHIPVSYGNFTKNTNSTYSSPQLLTDLTATTYRPVPLNEAESGGGTYGYVIGEDNITSNCEPALWDKDLEKFLPLTSGTSASVLKNGAYHTKGSVSLKRGFKFRPSDDDDVTNGGFTNPENAYDTNTTTAANRSSGSDITYEHKYHYGGFTGDMNQASSNIVWEIVVTMSTGTPGNIKLSYKFGSDSYTEITTEAVAGTYTGTETVANKPANIDEPLTLKMVFTSGSGDWSADCKIKDILTTYEVNKGDDQHRIAYTGADGLKKSYSSGTATNIHEAHRDLLHRYTSLDVSSDPTGWSSLDTDRSAWTLRYWLLEPISLKSVLDNIAYEGGFIYRMRQDNTLQYIHIENNPSTNHTLTKDDIKNFTISHTPFSNIISKTEYSYAKHPAENRYLSTATVTNSTTRTDYNIGTKDNVKKINLDALVASVSSGTGMNASHGNYYNELTGEVKILMSCDVVNDSIGYSIEVGDIVSISSMPMKAFATSFAIRFIVTSVNKTIGKTSIELYQISDTSSKGAPS